MPCYHKILDAWLIKLELKTKLTHEEKHRVAQEIEESTGFDHEIALKEGWITEEELMALIQAILARKKKRRKEAEAMVI
jgi:DNA-binding protein H-NS